MTTAAPALPKVALLKLTDVHPDADQPRKHFDLDELAALAQSIKQVGLIQPITVRQNTKGYVIVAGERRWRAAKLAKQQTIAALVTDADDDEALLRGTVENVARADLNVIEEGDAYLRIGGDEPVVAQIAKLVSRPEHRVADRIKLARLPGPIREAVIDGGISLDAARTLAGVADQPGGDKVAVALAAGVRLNVFNTTTLAREPVRALFSLDDYDPSEVENPCPACKLTDVPDDADPSYNRDRGEGEQIKDGKTWRAATYAEYLSEEGEYRNCPTCGGEGVVVEKVEGAEWPEFFAVPVNGYSGIAPAMLAQLPDEARERVEAAQKRAHDHDEAMKKKHGYHWYGNVPKPNLDGDEIADAALAAGCAVRIGERVLVTDPAFVAEYLPASYDTAVAEFEKKKPSSNSSGHGVNGSGARSQAEKDAAAKEREKAKKDRMAARQFNADLGRAIQTKLGEVPVTTDAMKLIVRTLLDETRGSEYMDKSKGHALWQRLTRTDWPRTKDGQPIIPRKGDAREAFVKDALAAAHKELAAAKSPEQALAVWVRFLAHGVADASGLPNADLEGMFSYRTQADGWRAFVLARLPKAVRDRAPKANGIPGRSYSWGD